MKWIEPFPVIPGDQIRSKFGTTLILAEQLAKKGIQTINQADQFLDSAKFPQTSPYEFPDMEKAIKRISVSIEKKERIGIWGDFDVDGQTSTAILVDGLRKLGAEVVFHVPVRSTESHGIRLESLNRFIDQQKPDLFITCDTGISENDSLAYLNAEGIHAIITDHHVPPKTLPLAHSIINPALLPENHQFHSLAGVGTAFQIIRALSNFLKPADLDLESNYYDLVSLGTIADLAELIGENRFYVKKGLHQMNHRSRKALSILMDAAGFGNVEMNESHISFALAPRLNSAGRLDDANPVVDFLISTDDKFLAVTARKLDELNNRRKIAVEMVVKSAIDMLESKKELLQYPVIVLEREKWESGVVGIAASRLIEIFYKPTFLLTSLNGIASGSVRSIKGINIIKAIEENSRYLIKYGGHPMAAGISLRSEMVPEFREAISQTVSRMSSGIDLERKLEIDAYVSLVNIGKSLLNETNQLAPFGPGNPPPVFVSTNLEIEKSAYIGKSGEHRKIIIKDRQGTARNAIWWNSANMSLPKGLFDLAFYLRRDDYSGRDEAILECIDYKEVAAQTSVIHQQVHRFSVVDYRNTSNQMAVIKEISKKPDIILWAEGVSSLPFMVSNRLALTGNNEIALLVAPPDLFTLKQIIANTNPKRIYLFSLLLIDDSPKKFLENFIGITNYCLRHKSGQTTIEALASAIGYNQNTIILGLELLAAKGLIEFNRENDNLSIRRTTEQPAQNLKEFESRLLAQLNEVSAFRSYYLRVSPDSLMDSISS